MARPNCAGVNGGGVRRSHSCSDLTPPPKAEYILFRSESGARNSMFPNPMRMRSGAAFRGRVPGQCRGADEEARKNSAARLR